MSFLKFREVPQPLQARVDICRENRKSNCYGSAFFLLEVLPYDIDIQTGRGFITEALKRMTPCNCQDRCLAITRQDNEIIHASFVEKANPFFGYQRRGTGCKFEEIGGFEDIEAYLRTVRQYARCNFKHEFYCLSPEDKLLDWAKRMVALYGPWE
jgi:hypothetical protein